MAVRGWQLAEPVHESASTSGLGSHLPHVRRSPSPYLPVRGYPRTRKYQTTRSVRDAPRVLLHVGDRSGYVPRMARPRVPAELAQMLTALRAEQGEDRQTLEALEAQIRPVRDRMDARQKAIDSLDDLAKTIAPPEPLPEPSEPQPHGVADSVEVQGSSDVTVPDPSLATAARSSRRSDTTERVWEISRHAGRPVSRQEIYREFEQRGWVDPKWSSIPNVINNAISRAKIKYEFVELTRGLYEVNHADQTSAPGPQQLVGGEGQ